MKNLAKSMNVDVTELESNAELMNQMLENAFERYWDLSLFGTAEKCNAFVNRLHQIGVNELACLIDLESMKPPY